MARRPLLTATAAATLLCALWFVPSAKATDGADGAAGAASAPSTLAVTNAGDEVSGPALAETGAGVDTTPYLIGGTAFLAIGAAFVAHAGRRAGA
ncbi:hypothetical protein [Streptomyces sp. NPDC051286]|uniref:hypothetical protein n=1 Tax=Streptomyces sp. NPDC051286 TaxID=3365647 RepID=UPI003787B84B